MPATDLNADIINRRYTFIETLVLSVWRRRIDFRPCSVYRGVRAGYAGSQSFRAQAFFSPFAELSSALRSEKRDHPGTLLTTKIEGECCIDMPFRVICC